jgi:hypothetical protein
MFENCEKIEKTIINIDRYLSLNLAVTFGRKGSNDKRLDAVYTNSYNSNKYADKSKLTNYWLNSREYLVLSYKDRNEGNYEDIYMSYPHLVEFESKINNLYSLILDEEVYAQSNGDLYINPQYKSYSVKIENMIGGKSILIKPAIVNNYYTGDDEPGIAIYVGKKENYTGFNFKKLQSIIRFLDEFNLSVMGQMLANFALMASNGGGSGSINNSIVANNIPRRSSSSKKKSSNATRNGNKAKRRATTNPIKNIDEDNENEDLKEEIEEEISDNSPDAFNPEEIQEEDRNDDEETFEIEDDDDFDIDDYDTTFLEEELEKDMNESVSKEDVVADEEDIENDEDNDEDEEDDMELDGGDSVLNKKNLFDQIEDEDMS